jgi:hypothetical protein
MSTEFPVSIGHHYTVQCECGYKQINFDDRVPFECKTVKINWCRTCCSRCAGIPNQKYYTADGDRIK